jgi:hypothetical protein
MLLPSFLFWIFSHVEHEARGDGSSASDTAARSATSDTAARPAAQDTASAGQPREGGDAPKERKPGSWDEVIALLQHVQSEGQRAPVCRMASREGQWLEVFTRQGEWRPVSRPQATATAALTAAPPLHELRGLRADMILSCDLAKPWVAQVQLSQETIESASARVPADGGAFVYARQGESQP